MESVLQVLKGLIAVIFLASATVLCCLAIYLLAVVRVLTPVRQARSALSRVYGRNNHLLGLRKRLVDSIIASHRNQDVDRG